MVSVRTIGYFFIWLAFVLLMFSISDSRSRADIGLPGGVTCEQVVEYARMLAIPNTWRGRAQARVIAATLGIVITDAQLAEAAKCLRSANSAPKEN